MTTSTRRVTVGDLMTADPVVATVDMRLTEAAELLDFYRVSGLPVVDRTGALVGVVSQTDILHARATEQLWSVWVGLAVRHVMTHPAVSVTASVSIERAAQLMEERRIHRLVVTASDGETPIGVLSVSDLVRSLVEEEPSR
jgi:CBS domain-containing protein